MRMPFGKHKGEPVWALPDGYVQWLFFQDFLSSDLESEVAREVSVRWPHVSLALSNETYPDNGVNAEYMKNIISSAFREVAQKFHPDRGGCCEIMKGINIMHEALQKRLAEYA